MDELDLIEMDIRHSMQVENRNAVVEALNAGLSDFAMEQVNDEFQRVSRLYFNAVRLPVATIERGEAILAFEQASHDLDVLIDGWMEREKLRLAWLAFSRELKQQLCSDGRCLLDKALKFWRG